MQALPASIAPSAPSGITVKPKRELEAFELYRRFQAIAAKNLPNDKLADAICQAINGVHKNQIYPIKACKVSLKNCRPPPQLTIPYPLPRVLEALKMDLPDLVGHMFKRATFISLVFEQTFKLYLRQRVSSEKKFINYQVDADSLLRMEPAANPAHETSLDGISATGEERRIYATDIPKDSFIVFIAHNKTYRFEPPFHPKFYFSRPALNASIVMRQVPFHHEVQRDNLCGMHAVNAFVGYHFLNDEKFMEYKNDWSDNCDVPRGTGKQDGVDPAFLKYILNKIVSSQTEFEIVCVDTNTESNRQALLKELQPIDRFLVGSVGSSGHCAAYRRDNDKAWWQIDSERHEQDSFEDDSELVDDMLEDADTNLIFFLFPRGVKEITFKDEPPTV